MRSCCCFWPQGLLFSLLFILFTLFRGTKWTV
nr:MAG TPA: NAD(P)H-quinone oxidoreductase subunit 1 [Caudoviricetes sp.]